ncbi:hypothetical protein MKK68_28130 [Methylobacterium sp. E-016]|uniref:hypothetical protein n=1 Tax=Methylobacterium sp. E-016 TaxID=2836556 RepID=UPI001FBA8707|nr:hypothetical protein [Methylobacterium sp. E-016]MCJ2079454.1 hypothetical protein [Methylobacterium sp. E-016]
MRVLGGYLAAVAAAVTVLMLAGATAALVGPPPPPVAEPDFPSDWVTVAITFVMATLFVTVFALPAFLVCQAVSVLTGLRHPAVHVVCGVAIGLTLWRLFSGMVDRPVQAAVAGAVGGAVYWRLAVRGIADGP